MLKSREFFLFLLLPLVLAAAVALRPAEALTVDETRHLLGRVAFGATPNDYKTFAPLSRVEAVRYLLDGARKTAVTPLPSWAADSAPMFPRRRTKEERKATAGGIQTFS